MNGKHIVLGITGGIAAYKSVFLLRLLKKAGAEVQVILTPSAKEFITPVTLSSLSGNPVITEFFTANTGEWHSHVDLGLWADLMVIAPATANTIAKMAHGIADNMLLTSYLSARAKVMIAPAMDLDMYKHPATQRNLQRVIEDGVSVIEPGSGELASGLEGKGRMAEPEQIFKAIEEYFIENLSLKGKKALVTAGPTFEKIDPVRFIGNFSSGKMGYSLAEELAKRGADVTLVSGPSSLTVANNRIRKIDIETALQMKAECEKVYADVDIAVFSAAVADYRPENYHDKKIKREKEKEQNIRLVQNPDIAYEMGLKKKNQINIGFALETDNELENAKSKLIKKNFDWIVLNSMKEKGTCFNSDNNKVTMISKEGEILSYPVKSKKEVAKDIIDTIARSLAVI